MSKVGDFGCELRQLASETLAEPGNRWYEDRGREDWDASVQDGRLGWRLASGRGHRGGFGGGARREGVVEVEMRCTEVVRRKLELK